MTEQKWIRWQFNMRNVTRKYFHRIKYNLKVYFEDAHELFGSIYKPD